MKQVASTTVSPVFMTELGIQPEPRDEAASKAAVKRATKLFNDSFGKRLRKAFKLFDTTAGEVRDGIRYFEVYVSKHKSVDYVCEDETYFGSLGVPEGEGSGKFRFIMRRHNTTPVVDSMDELAERFVEETWGGWSWFRNKVCAG